MLKTWIPREPLPPGSSKVFSTLEQGNKTEALARPAQKMGVKKKCASETTV